MSLEIEKKTATTTIHELASEDRKNTVTSTTTALPLGVEAVAAEESGTRKPSHSLAAAVWAIVCGVALPCIPVIVVSAVLLYFIFHYQIILAPGWPELQLHANKTHQSVSAYQTLHDIRHQGGHPAYYVHYNPSTITTIASWTGRVIPYLSSSIMALVAFFAARRIVTKSKRGDGSDLPTPEQLTLLIGLLGGNSFGPLRDTMLHRWAARNRLVDPIPLAFYALFIVTSIGVLIPIVDTWFGIATTPAVITQLYNHTAAPHTFGRTLSGSGRCSNGPGGFWGFGDLFWLSCNIDWDDADEYGIDGTLVGPDEASRLVQGVSTQNVILNYTAVDGLTYYYLADPGMDAKLDCKASTFAMTSQCTPITQKCLPGSQWPDADWSSNDNVYNFSCSPGFQANFTFNGASQYPDSNAGYDQSYDVPMVGIAFSPDSSLSSRVGVYDPGFALAVDSMLPPNGTFDNTTLVGTNWSYPYLFPQNPLHFAVWASGFPTYDAKDVNSGDIVNPLLNDSQIWQADVGDFTYWILGCSAVVYDVSYTWVNGSIHTFAATAASDAMGGLISAPFAFGSGPAAVALNAVADLAGTQNTSTDLANVFARGWSKAALALSAGVMSSAANDIEQIRDSTVAVARVPMIPLYLLLGLKGLYVLAVIVLAIGAYCFTHPAETEVVKAQLSAKGLAAAHFDTPALVQQNVVKEIGARIASVKNKTTDDIAPASKAEDPGQPGGVKRAETAPATVGQNEERRVGLVATADGAWKFAVVADGVWKSIKPIAVNLLDLAAKDEDLGTVGKVINAW